MIVRIQNKRHECLESSPIKCSCGPNMVVLCVHEKLIEKAADSSICEGSTDADVHSVKESGECRF